MQRPAAGSAGPHCHSPRPPGVRGKGAEAPPQSLRFGLASAARPSSSWQTSLRRFCQPRPWSETCSRWTAGLRLPSPFFSALCSPFPPSKYRHFPYSRSSSGCVATGTAAPSSYRCCCSTGHPNQPIPSIHRIATSEYTRLPLCNSTTRRYPYPARCYSTPFSLRFTRPRQCPTHPAWPAYLATNTSPSFDSDGNQPRVWLSELHTRATWRPPTSRSQPRTTMRHRVARRGPRLHHTWPRRPSRSKA